MFRGIIIAGCLAAVGLSLACVASAQTSNGRTSDLIAQLDKTKHKVKDKGSFHFESYMDVRNEPVTMKPTDLAGSYVSPDSPDFQMELSVASDGTATATGRGFEMVGANSVRINFTFKGRVDGALLTGTRTFENGRSENFEAVFVRHTVREGSKESDARVTYTGFGLGYIQQDEHWTNRVYLEKR